MLKRKGKDSYFPTEVHFNSPNVLLYLGAAITAPTACLRGSCWVPLINFKLKLKQKARLLLLLHVKQASKKALLSSPGLFFFFL